MRNFLLVIVLGSIAASTHGAPPTDESIDQMMKAVQLEQLIAQTVAQMDIAMKTGMDVALKQSLKGKEPTAAQRAAVEKCEEKLAATLNDELAVAKTKALYTQAYRETFTQEEVNGVIAFYNSPSGKAMAEKLPGAMQKTGEQMQERIAPLMKKLETMRQDCMKDVANVK